MSGFWDGFDQGLFLQDCECRGGLGIGDNWMSFGGAKISECSSMSPDELHAGLGGVVSEEGKPAKGMGDDGILQVELPSTLRTCLLGSLACSCCSKSFGTGSNCSPHHSSFYTVGDDSLAWRTLCHRKDKYL